MEYAIFEVWTTDLENEIYEKRLAGLTSEIDAIDMLTRFQARNPDKKYIIGWSGK